MANKPKTVDEYLASLSEDKRNALKVLRNAILAIVPGADEGFSYGLPAFRVKGRPLVAYGAVKNHCSLYPMSPSVIEKLKSDLDAFETSKGTIRFSPENPLPDYLIRKVVEARIAELQNE